MQFRTLYRGYGPSLLLVTLLLSACGAKKDLSPLVNALNTNVSGSEAMVPFGSGKGRIKQVTLKDGGEDYRDKSKLLKVDFQWCSVYEGQKPQEECAPPGWEQKSVFLRLNLIDPAAIAIKADPKQPSISLSCQGEDECANPALIGLPCADQATCERGRDNLTRLVRFAQGGKLEPPRLN
jgi:hypothetical protein